MLNRRARAAAIISIVVVAMLLGASFSPGGREATAANVLLLDDFESTFTLEETQALESAAHKSWWLNSGAYFYSSEGTGRTVRGALSEHDRWRRTYAETNATDTGFGAHPQNVFRLLTKQNWYDPDISMYVRIEEVRQAERSEEARANGDDGILLFSRYIDNDTLYYAGVRADGFAVIKKKENGQYETLAERKIFRHSSSNNGYALPLSVWFGVRSITETEVDGSVTVRFLVDPGETGVWHEVLLAQDVGTERRPALRAPGLAGVRTDYMDAVFDSVVIFDRQSIKPYTAVPRK